MLQDRGSRAQSSLACANEQSSPLSPFIPQGDYVPTLLLICIIVAGGGACEHPQVREFSEGQAPLLSAVPQALAPITKGAGWTLGTGLASPKVC